MRSDSGHHQQHDVSAGDAQRNTQNPFGTFARMAVDVHPLSVRVAQSGFKVRGSQEFFECNAGGGLSPEQSLQVPVVVQKIGALHPLQNAVHPFAGFAAHFSELHGHTRSRMDSCDGALGVQFCVVH